MYVLALLLHKTNNLLHRVNYLTEQERDGVWRAKERKRGNKGEKGGMTRESQREREGKREREREREKGG